MARSPRNNTLAGKITDRQLDLIVRQIASLPIAPPVGKAMLNLSLQAPPPQGQALEFQQRLLGLARLDIYLTAWLTGTPGEVPGQSRKSPARSGGDFHRLQSVILSANLRQLLQPAPPSRLDLVEFWRHSVATAVAAREIAAHLALGVEAQDAFACGLLHDLGKLAMDSALPKSYARALAADKTGAGNIAQSEHELLGLDHTVFGRRLAAHWRLAPLVESVIWLHHQDARALPESVPDRRLIAAVGLADALARKLEIGYSGNFTFLHPLEDWAKQLGCADGFISQLEGNLQALVDKELARLDAGAPAAEAGSAIAEHLARRNQELTWQNQILSGKARSLDIIRDFVSGISEETSVARVLSQIAQASAQAMDIVPSASRGVVAYSLECWGSAPAAMACRCDGPGSFAWRTLNCAAIDPAADAPATAPAAADLLAGSDDLSDWLDAGDSRHEPICVGGQWIGGIFLPSESDARADANWAGLVAAMGMALGIVQGQARSMRLNEELSSASRVLAETSRALSEAQTIAAIAQMAAGAAHELNNPLAVISGRAQLMKGKSSTPEERKAWTTIFDQAQRISDTITDLMNFASPPVPEPKPVDARALLESAAKAFAADGAAQDTSPTVDIDVDDSLPQAYVDQAQLEAVIRELLTNAANAGGQGVRIRLSASLADDELLLCVADDGPGMDDRTCEQAFTPFFSGQPAGRRRGLGLARARRWVEINGGSVQLTSRTGAGTRVLIRIPAAK